MICRRLAFCILVALQGCSSLQATPPDYIKDVTAYKEGSEGLVVYFILADKSGRMTRAGGNVTLSIVEADNESSELELYRFSADVKASDFQTTKIGMGTFERKVTLCSFGRITYSSFLRYPFESTGKVRVTFKDESGRSLTGEDTIFF